MCRSGGVLRLVTALLLSSLLWPVSAGQLDDFESALQLLKEAGRIEE